MQRMTRDEFLRWAEGLKGRYPIVRARRREIIHHRRQDDAILSRTVTIGAIRLDPPGYRA